MGYFSNGSEGMDYQAQWCDRCVNYGPEDGPGCAVWEAHMLYNYAECNNEESILHVLIPRTKDGWNAQCRMFQVKPEAA
jgi:hypothetical protein